MSELKLAEYCAKHRHRQRGLENGSVRKGGVRVQKWIGVYHVYVPDGDGGEKRIKRYRVIAPCSGMTKTEAREEHRAWIRRLHQKPVAATPRATFRMLAEDYFSLNSVDWSDVWEATKRGMYDNVLLPALGDQPLDSITAEDLKRFINALPRRQWRTPRFVGKNGKLEREPGKLHKGISESYVKKISTLRAIFDLAIEQDLIVKTLRATRTSS